MDEETGSPQRRTSRRWLLGIGAALGAGGLFSTYRPGEDSEPSSPGSTAVGIFVVTDFGADPTGSRSSSDAFDAAHRAARSYGAGGVVFYPSGRYRVTRTVRPGGLMHHVFGLTHVIAEGRAEDFTEVLSWAGDSLRDLSQGDFPSAVPERTVRALWDLDHCSRSVFTGDLVLDGGSVRGLAGMANSLVSGAAASSIGCTINGELRVQSCDIGLYGTPRYSADVTRAPVTFNQWSIARLYIAGSVPTPIVAGDNSFDDAWIGNFHLAAGGTSYVFLSQLHIGSCFLYGDFDGGYGFHVRRALLKFGTLYAEGGRLTAPIYADRWAMVEGALRLGAGGNTSFGSRCLVLVGAESCSVHVSIHPRTADADPALTDGVVKLMASDSARRVTVRQPYPDRGSRVPAVVYEDGVTSTADHIDVLDP